MTLFKASRLRKRQGSEMFMMIETLDPRAAGARRLQGKVCIVTGAGQDAVDARGARDEGA